MMKLQLTSILFVALLAVGCSKGADDTSADASKAPATTSATASTPSAPAAAPGMPFDEYSPKLCAALDTLDAQSQSVNSSPDAAGAQQILDKEKDALDQIKALQAPSDCQPIQDAAVKYAEASIATSTAVLDSQKSGKTIPADTLKTLQTNGLTAMSDLATAAAGAGYDPQAFMQTPKKLVKAAAGSGSPAPSGTGN